MDSLYIIVVIAVVIFLFRFGLKKKTGHPIQPDKKSDLQDKGDFLDINEYDWWSRLKRASRYGDLKLIKTLPNKSPKVGCNYEMALILASANGHETVVKVLLEKGAEVDHRNNFGPTALIEASANGREAIVKMLLEKGANVNLQREFGRTALMDAIQEGHVSVVQVLLENGAEVNHQDNDGWTALMVASERGREGVVNMLLEKGADVNIQNHNGKMALNMAKTDDIWQLLKDTSAK